MNVNSIINMITHQVMRRLINHGMNVGTDFLSKSARNRQSKHDSLGDIDDYGNTIDPRNRSKNQTARRQRRQDF